MQVNKKAPDFSLLNQDNKKVSLSDFKNKWVVLYFYPKDMTSGCTIEGKDFSSQLSKFQKLNCIVLGVSPDSPDSHAKFIKKEGFKHSLLSDESKKTLEKFGVWQEKSMYGRKYMGVVRTTILIDPSGVIKKAWDKVKVPGHVDDVYNTLKVLQ